MDSYGGGETYHKIMDYKKKTVTEQFQSGKCTVSKYELDFDLKETMKYMYDPEAGKLEYRGLIDCPWEDGK